MSKHNYLLTEEFHRSYVQNDFENNEHVMPHLTLFMEDSALVLPIKIPDDAMKRMFDLIARKMVHETKASAYLFISEAWFIVRNDGKCDVRPMDADDRQECLLYNVGIDGQEHNFRYVVNRDAHGNPSLGEASQNYGVVSDTVTRFMTNLTDMGPYERAPDEVKLHIDAIVTNFLNQHAQREKDRKSNKIIH